MTGFALACVHCRFRFPMDITTGVMAAHFQTEHGTDEVKVELVVVCRCDEVMTLTRTAGQRHFYDCPGCHRSRTVTQTPG
jgi:hypothetical protein